MKHLHLKSVKSDLLPVLIRFHVVLVFVFGLAVMAFLELNDKQFEKEFNVWGFFILGTFISLSVTLFKENLSNKLSKAVVILIPVLSVFFYCFFLFNNKTEWEMMQFVAFALAAFLSVYFVLFFRKNTDTSFWVFSEKITRELIITYIYTSFLFGGLSLAIFAVNELFNVKIEHEVYGNFAIVCYLIIAPVYFLSNIPNKNKIYDEAPDYGKFLKILGLYVFLPVLILYIFILYFYLLKIVILWELPNGWVTTLVSVLALGGFLTKYLLFPLSDNKIVRFLNNYFALIILPLIVLMSVGLGRRISDYGLSINRIYVLIFNVWLYGACIYLFITKSKHLRWLVISFAAVLFVSSVGPWSVFAVTRRIIEKDLTVLLTENKLLVDGKIVDNKDNKIKFSDNVSQAIYDKVFYYITNYDIKSWKDHFNDQRDLKGVFQLTESLGVDNKLKQWNSKFVSGNLPEGEVLNVSGFSELITNIQKQENTDSIFKNDNLKIELVHNLVKVTNLKSKQQTNFSLSGIVSELQKNKDSEIKNHDLFIQKTGEYMLLINNISVRFKKGKEYEINDLNISLFVK